MNPNRDGIFMKRPSGYVAFIPNPLPPERISDSEQIALQRGHYEYKTDEG